MQNTCREVRLYSTQEEKDVAWKREGGREGRNESEMGDR